MADAFARTVDQRTFLVSDFPLTESGTIILNHMINLLLRKFGTCFLLTESGTIILNHLINLLLRKFGKCVILDNSFLEEYTLAIYKSIFHPCIESCNHICSAASAVYLDILDKIQTCIDNVVRS